MRIPLIASCHEATNPNNWIENSLGVAKTKVVAWLGLLKTQTKFNKGSKTKSSYCHITVIASYFSMRSIMQYMFIKHKTSKWACYELFSKKKLLQKLENDTTH